MSAFTQAETCEMWLQAGVARHRGGPILAFAKGFYGGVLLSLGGIVALIIGGGESALTATYPGLNKLITATVFPIGLIMIVLLGADLVTSNMAIMAMAAVKRRVPIYSYPMNIAIVFFGNLFGSLWTAGIFGYYSGIFTGPYAAWAITFATGKVVPPTWGMVLVRGFACNFLVCVAVFLATMSKDVLSKIVSIELPIFLFVACGYDHVVANMLFIPLGLMLQAPTLSVGLYISKSLIPSFIGNLFGATFLAIPLLYFYCFNDAVDLEMGVISSEKDSSMKKGGGSSRVDSAED